MPKGQAPRISEAKKSRVKTLEDKLGTNKRNYKFLKFPLDVDTTATQNIMLININALSGSKGTHGQQYQAVEGETPVYMQSGSGSLARHFRGNSIRIDTAIALYMPSSIQTQYQANWAGEKLGVVGAGIDAWKGSGDLSIGFDMENGVSVGSGWQKVLNTIKENIGDVAMYTGVRMLDSLVPGQGFSNAFEFAQNMTTNPYVEVMFSGMSNRTFSFTFKFVPKSQEEQEAIKKIVTTLKYHQAPDKRTDSANLYMSYPSTFDISFLKKDGTINEWLFKLSTCALTEVNVQQGAENHYASFEDGSPLSTTVTLNFIELETLSRDRIAAGGF